jgi:hypothetical protein
LKEQFIVNKEEITELLFGEEINKFRNDSIWSVSGLRFEEEFEFDFGLNFKAVF